MNMLDLRAHDGSRGLADEGVRFFAVPVKVRSFCTFPVRAFCLV
jgi:hypothetical protein